MATSFDLSLGLEDTHVLVTGGCGLIGRVVVNAFLAAGAKVSVLDLPDAFQQVPDGVSRGLLHVPTDISKGHQVDQSFSVAEKAFGPVECCIALASIDLSSLPATESICDMDPDSWRKVIDVNVNGTFYTAQRWLKGIRSAAHHPESAAKLKNVGLVIMGSEAGRFGVRSMAAYSAGKAAVQYGLMQSMAQDAPRIYIKARVNAVAPGAVDTRRFKEECERFGQKWAWEQKEATVPLAKAVSVEDVARTFVFLASEKWSGSTHGQLLAVDAGKTGSFIWHEGEVRR